VFDRRISRRTAGRFRTHVITRELVVAGSDRHQSLRRQKHPRLRHWPAQGNPDQLRKVGFAANRRLLDGPAHRSRPLYWRSRLPGHAKACHHRRLARGGVALRRSPRSGSKPGNNQASSRFREAHVSLHRSCRVRHRLGGLKSATSDGHVQTGPMRKHRFRRRIGLDPGNGHPLSSNVAGNLADVHRTAIITSRRLVRSFAAM
jgi:hypothetical protein